MGTTYTSEEPARPADGGWGTVQRTGEARQNLVAPEVRSVTNKPSKSVFSFIASRKALPINAPQSPNSGRISPTSRHSHTHLSHLQAFAHSVPSARIPSSHPLARSLASLTENSFNGRFLEYLVCCRLLVPRTAPNPQGSSRDV